MAHSRTNARRQRRCINEREIEVVCQALALANTVIERLLDDHAVHLLAFDMRGLLLRLDLNGFSGRLLDAERLLRVPGGRRPRASAAAVTAAIGAAGSNVVPLHPAS